MRAVNLLPPDLRGAAKATVERVAGPEASGGAGPFVVLGVLAACVAGATGYVLTTNNVKQRQADLAAITMRQQALATQAATLKPYADFDALAKARVQTVRDLAGSRFDWERVLNDLSRAVPGNVTLKGLSGDLSTDTGSGGSSVRGAISAPAITLTGCAPDQTQVARLMARLHDVDGVTRVSLSKSDSEKVTAATGDSTQSEAQTRNSMPCGTGKRPAFEVVAFFENAKAAVPATAANAPATPAATPAAGATPTPTVTATPGTVASTTTSQGAAK